MFEVFLAAVFVFSCVQFYRAGWFKGKADAYTRLYNNRSKDLFESDDE